jgi:hypothetical protein
VAGFEVSTEVVVSATDDHSCSTEQDILAIDTHVEAPLFWQGDLAIVFPVSALAAISVKTRLTKENVADSVKGLNSVRSVAHDDSVDGARIWCGAYFFERPESPQDPLKYYEWIRDAVLSNSVKPPPLAFGVQVAVAPNVLTLSDNELFRTTHENDDLRIHGFDCDGLATGMFIASVLDHIAALRGRPRAAIASVSEELRVRNLDPANVTINIPWPPRPSS